MVKQKKKMQRRKNAFTVLIEYILSMENFRVEIAEKLGIAPSTLMRLSKKIPKRGYHVIEKEDKDIAEEVLRTIIMAGYAALKELREDI